MRIGWRDRDRWWGGHAHTIAALCKIKCVFAWMIIFKFHWQVLFVLAGSSAAEKCRLHNSSLASRDSHER